MTKRRRALRDVLTVQQFRDLLNTAVRIKDPVESVAIAFFLVTMGRLGMRVGEVIHMEESWYDPERGVISVPPHVDCDCGLCRHYAEQYADRHNLDPDEVIDDYWKVKDGSDRDIYIETERDQKIIELYFELVPYTSVSYSTVNRRLKKVAELTDGVDPERVYPHMLRATAATHMAWSGFAPSLLDYQFGWQDEKTKEKYTKKTGLAVKREYARLHGRVDEDELFLREDPPLYSELRPDDHEKLIKVDSWAVDYSIESHPRTRDEEPLLHDLDEYTDSGTIEPLSPLVRARLSYEYETVQESSNVGYQGPRRTAAAAGGMLLWSAWFGTMYAQDGLFGEILAGDPTTIASVGIAGAIYLPYLVWSTHELTHDDPKAVDPETPLDRVILHTHSAVDRVMCRARSWYDTAAEALSFR